MKSLDTLDGFEDIHLVAAASYFGIPIESIDRTSAYGKVTFYFCKSKELDELVRSYWNGSVAVEPRRFAYCIRDIKARINTRNID